MDISAFIPLQDWGFGRRAARLTVPSIFYRASMSTLSPKRSSNAFEVELAVLKGSCADRNPQSHPGDTESPSPAVNSGRAGVRDRLRDRGDGLRRGGDLRCGQGAAAGSPCDGGDTPQEDPPAVRAA